MKLSVWEIESREDNLIGQNLETKQIISIFAANNGYPASAGVVNRIDIAITL